jgi:hypothetical protein
MAGFMIQSQSYDGRYMELRITQDKDIAANTSTLNWTLTVKGGNSNYYTTGPTTVKINNTQVYKKGVTYWNSYNFPAAKGSTSGSIVVAHDEEGNATVPVSLSTAIYTGTVETKSGNIELDSIPRGAKIETAPNFHDEEKPTITYTNYAGSNATLLQACIASEDGKTIYVPYRNISKTGTSYTFTFTNAEKEALWGAVTRSYYTSVRFYIKSVVGGTTFISYSNKVTLTLANCFPSFKPSAVDVNTITTSLTGNPKKLIRFYSNVKCEFLEAAAKKGATITAYEVTSGSKKLTVASGYMQNVDSEIFNFKLTDSRGNSTVIPVTLSIMDYVQLTCDIVATTPTAAGDCTVTVKGNCFSGNFGNKNNFVQVQFRYKKNNEAFSNWEVLTRSYGTNTYTATKKLTGLDYKSTYTLEAWVTDDIYSKNAQPLKVKALPVFDWSGTDFNFNVPVSFEGNTMADLVIEEGTSGDWYYRKWLSGRAELDYRAKVNATITSQKGQLYRTEPITLSLPFSMPECFANVDCLDGNCWGSVVTYGLPASSFRYVIWCPWTHTGELIVAARVTGRWK